MSSQMLIEKFQNHACPICAPKNRRGGATFFFPIDPKSAQSLSSKKGATAQFRNNIKTLIDENHYRQIASSSGPRYPLNIVDPLEISIKKSTKKVCIGLLFCLKMKKINADVDNMAKAFLDAIKGIDGLISDDIEIVHLDAIKITDNSVSTTFWKKNPDTGATIPHASTSMIGLRIISVSEDLVL